MFTGALAESQQRMLQSLIDLESVQAPVAFLARHGGVSPSCRSSKGLVIHSSFTETFVFVSMDQGYI